MNCRNQREEMIVTFRNSVYSFIFEYFRSEFQLSYRWLIIVEIVRDLCLMELLYDYNFLDYMGSEIRNSAQVA